MFYRRPSRWNRLRRQSGLRALVRFAAGIHAANGVAHGVRPARDSAALTGTDRR
jgi:hypothetical protein